MIKNALLQYVDAPFANMRSCEEVVAISQCLEAVLLLMIR